ncbi:dTDP-4-dehydrorhamnose 3,5-epimerase family protein [Clostridium chauvoei]|uniref:dTDP-4-dehydrorhamnose 3,5-epimerase family protein n=2 Tax=Clostridium chauvoei TaxID=46867 RepID=A0ABD4RJ07_9CLOT|nr:dTDP-4-dehydrorhamnose 3,5-epimerase family protein [Clostridium chauvoei]MBX7281287.1 dTDP-4-dehydrorhamnose 3,5-epimerase family protein [Clostridium chauvoei]MBX7283807.1 dTDP-4-dehydrorhamnose 3,5-epimerase family protein [Clostridium chauvoei]MBX7286376.1 dTDP-4-dehydrorhamnose 3,5-epimerase family protein [Clostridium chauvoei]MBX7288817.1 dTDP-4-dehydrorhamnose 3,5-epimerase family protein [Clostridium chauvoei]MBX7291409.1 dTDP-4-dehydrorhamnose 3,5-epimerase family protein [Clostri
MFRVKPLGVEGCFVITPSISMNNTCDLIKVFNDIQFNIYGLSTEFKEEYYAIAKPGALRGMHFQAPPEAHDKLVTCIKGEIQDVVVDLRKDSKTFGKYAMVDLNETNKELLYIPKGCAHGYYIKGDKEALIFYKVTKPFIPEYRGGIHWSSLNIPWDFQGDISVEEEDENFPRFEDFQSPF